MASRQADQLVHDSEGGITGYLIWLGKNNPAAYARLLARVLPLQVNQKSSTHRGLSRDCGRGSRQPARAPH